MIRTITIKHYQRLSYTVLSNELGDMSGDYVPLAEYEKLRRLIERLLEFDPLLTKDIDKVTFQYLLTDCKEAINE